MNPQVVKVDMLYWEWPRAALAIGLTSLLLWDSIAAIAVLSMR